MYCYWAEESESAGNKPVIDIAAKVDIGMINSSMIWVFGFSSEIFPPLRTIPITPPASPAYTILRVILAHPLHSNESDPC